MILIGLYHLFSVAIFSIVVFIDVYTVTILTSSKTRFSKETRLGLSFVVTSIITFCIIHYYDLLFNELTLSIFTIISGILMGIFLESRHKQRTKYLSNASEELKPVARIPYLRVIGSILFSILFFLFWQWVGKQVLLATFF
jgi:hypothetical protein